MTRHTCPPDHAHDETTTCYTSHRCRCDACTLANTERSFYRRHMLDAGRADVFEQLVDGRGVNRRLQALTANGWSAHRLGQRLGVTADQIHIWYHRGRVTATTHARVSRLYDELADLTPPTDTTGDRISVHRARSTAARRGWARPIDWDDIDHDDAPQTGIPVHVDEVRVQHAVDGARIRLTRAERHLAVKALHARGYGDPDIARLLLVADKTIARDRGYLDLPANDINERLVA